MTSFYVCRICNASFKHQMAWGQHYGQCKTKYMEMRERVSRQSNGTRAPTPRGSSAHQVREQIRQREINTMYANQRAMQERRRQASEKGAKRMRYEEEQRRLRQQEAMERARMSTSHRETVQRRQQIIEANARRLATNQINVDHGKRQQHMAEAQRRQQEIAQVNARRQQIAQANAQRERMTQINTRHQRPADMGNRQQRLQEINARQQRIEQATTRQRTIQEPAPVQVREMVERPLSGAITHQDLFLALVKGRRVVIVGPSNSLTGSGQGPRIDSFDLVVRLNKSFRIPKGKSGDLGTRIDILYNNLNLTDSPGENVLNIPRLRDRGVKFICSPYPPVPPFDRDISRHMRESRGIIPFHHIDSQLYNRICQYIQSRPLTGTCAIFDLLKFSPEELHICGMDFYMHNYYKGYQRDLPDKAKLRQMRDNRIHQMAPQVSLLRHSLAGKRNVTLDATLDRILYGKYWTAISSISSLPHLNEEFAQLFSSDTPIVLRGATGQTTQDPPRGILVSMVAIPCDVLVHTGAVEREIKTRGIPEHRLALLIKAGLPGASVPAGTSKAIHQAVKPLGITNLSAELFTLLLLASWRRGPLYTVAVDLGANSNTTVNAQEESTLMKLLFRAGIISQIY